MLRPSVPGRSTVGASGESNILGSSIGAASLVERKESPGDFQQR